MLDALQSVDPFYVIDAILFVLDMIKSQETRKVRMCNEKKRASVAPGIWRSSKGLYCNRARGTALALSLLLARQKQSILHATFLTC